MIAYVDSISNGFAFLTDCPGNVQSFIVDFYKYTRAIREYLENPARFHRRTALGVVSLPRAVGRDFIGGVWLIRDRHNKECFRVNIHRGTGRVREDQSGAERVIHNLETIGNNCRSGIKRLDEEDEVLIFYQKLRNKRNIKNNSQ